MSRTALASLGLWSAAHTVGYVLGWWRDRREARVATTARRDHVRDLIVVALRESEGEPEGVFTIRSFARAVRTEFRLTYTPGNDWCQSVLESSGLATPVGTIAYRWRYHGVPVGMGQVDALGCEY